MVIRCTVHNAQSLLIIAVSRLNYSCSLK